MAAGPSRARRTDRAVGAALVAFSAVAFVGTTTFRDVPTMLSQNVPPTSFPRIVLGAIAILGVLVFITARPRRPDTATMVSASRHVALTAAILVAVVTLIPVLGMHAAIFAVVTVLPMSWGERRVVRVLVLAVIVTAAIHMIFGVALGMRFPAGLLA